MAQATITPSLEKSDGPILSATPSPSSPPKPKSTRSLTRTSFFFALFAISLSISYLVFSSSICQALGTRLSLESGILNQVQELFCEKGDDFSLSGHFTEKANQTLEALNNFWNRLILPNNDLPLDPVAHDEEPMNIVEHSVLSSPDASDFEDTKLNLDEHDENIEMSESLKFSYEKVENPSIAVPSYPISSLIERWSWVSHSTSHHAKVMWKEVSSWLTVIITDFTEKFRAISHQLLDSSSRGPSGRDQASEH